MNYVDWIGNFLVTGTVAGMAVYLGFSRYKAEKRWERRLDALAEVTSSLLDCRRAVSAWGDAVGNGKSVDGDHKRTAQTLLDAKRALASSAAVGFLLLPSDVADALERASKSLTNYPKTETYEDVVTHDLGVIEETLNVIRTRGRAILR